MVNEVEAEIRHFEDVIKTMNTSMARCKVSQKEYRNCDCYLCAFERNYIMDRIKELRGR